jgi:alpha-L-arabinofuranosidase
VPTLVSSSRGKAENAAVDLFSESASVKDGSVLLSLSNLDPSSPCTVRVEVRGATMGQPLARILTADALQAHNTPHKADAVAPRVFTGAGVVDGVLTVELPAHSFPTVSLPLR